MAIKGTETKRKLQQEPVKPSTNHLFKPASVEELKQLLEKCLEQVWEAAGGQEEKKMIMANNLSSEELEATRIVILLHDLHKVFPGNDFKHYSLPSPLKEADMYASRMARERTFARTNFTENNNRLRYSMATRTPVTKKEPKKRKLLRELSASNPSELHELILETRELTKLNEAKTAPFTSLKHHLLLTCALGEHFLETGNAGLQGMILCIDRKKPENVYKIIGKCYKGKKRHWLWLDNTYSSGGNAHLFLSFRSTWNNMVGMNPRSIALGSHVMAMNSWTAVLAMLENEVE
ncbi:MAG: hypothetical protein ACXAEU_11555 [Candidatus Hodarchaeales archaeon]|jgi:hypothetical protein